MLKFFEQGVSCTVLLEPPLNISDTQTLSTLFNKDYASWNVEFGRIYGLKADMLNLLYEEIFKNQKNISITTRKNKLNRYLRKLGFSTTFDSLIKDSVVDIENVKLVLIGGSADSSPKILNIIKNTTLDNLSLVIVQHVEPDRVGKFDSILKNDTKYKVSYAKDGEAIKKAHIYLAPNNKHLRVENGCFVLGDDEKSNYAKPSISVSYESFSKYYRESLLVIQECGYASDGVDKLEQLKANGSKLIIQDKRECEAKQMVLNAETLNIHDYILHESDIINYINLLDKKQDLNVWIEYLLEMILKRYGYDFRLYHRDMVERRLGVFMLKHEIKSIKNAVGVVIFNRSAFKGFFLDISINVTEFFRHQESFNTLIKLLNINYKNAHNIKIWSAGCSSGEEVYSMAIILDYIDMLKKSIIYATDFNSVILQEAKNGIYSKEIYELGKTNFNSIDIGNNLDNYFDVNSNFVTVVDKIKEKTNFFEHNLATDSSFNEFDIIICRNVVIYFDDDLQDKVFGLFYDSLKFGGHLILGDSESLNLKYSSKFKQSDDNCKIFKKVA